MDASLCLPLKMKFLNSLHKFLTPVQKLVASFLWDIGKQYSPRYDAAEHGFPSRAFLFANRIFIKNLFWYIYSYVFWHFSAHLFGCQRVPQKH